MVDALERRYKNRDGTVYVFFFFQNKKRANTRGRASFVSTIHGERGIGHGKKQKLGHSENIFEDASGKEKKSLIGGVRREFCEGLRLNEHNVKACEGSKEEARERDMEWY